MLELAVYVGCFIGNSIGSCVIGNSAHDGTKLLFKNLYSKLKALKPDENRDLLKALYRSYWQATFFIAKDVESRTVSSSIFDGDEREFINKVLPDVKAKLKQLDSSNAIALIEISSNDEINKFLDSLENLVKRQQMTDSAKDEQIKLCEYALNELQKSFGEIPKGFETDFRKRWFDHLCLSFAEQLKTDERVSTIFQAQMLADIKTNNGSLLSIEVFTAELETVSSAVKTGFDEMRRFLTSISDDVAEIKTGVNAVKETLEEFRGHFQKPSPSQIHNTMKPLIHGLANTKVYGREIECRILLDAMRDGASRVLVYTAPGGFGKTTLLTKLVQMIAPDEKTLTEPTINGFLHFDCRNSPSLSTILGNLGMLVGRREEFEEIAENGDLDVAQKWRAAFDKLSDDGKRTWIAVDNLESVLDGEREITDEIIKSLFEASFTGSHNARLILVSRLLPKVAPKNKANFCSLSQISEMILNGLPLPQCVKYLRDKFAEETDETCEEFARRVHRLPMALEWAVGYLSDNEMTLTELLTRVGFFEDFDAYQMRDGTEYLEKGLKRLHYEQLTQLEWGLPESLPILRLLAFFNREMPRAFLEHTGPAELELRKTLVKLKNDNLITEGETEDLYLRHETPEGFSLQTCAMHPILCENEFFDKKSDEFLEILDFTAKKCLHRAFQALQRNFFIYATEMFENVAQIHKYQVDELHLDKENDLARAYLNKGVAFGNSNRLEEAIDNYDKAIEIRERLIKPECKELESELAIAYLNKGTALGSFNKLERAIDELNKAVKIYERLIKDGRNELESELATAYLNKGNALWISKKTREAINELNKAIEIYERLTAAGRIEFISFLALAHMNKGSALWTSDKFKEAISEYDEATDIYERLLKDGRVGLENELAVAYMNKGNALTDDNQDDLALKFYDQAATLWRKLVQSGMIFLLPDLMGLFWNRYKLFAKMRDWVQVAETTEEALSYCRFALENKSIHDKLKQATVYNFSKIIDPLRNLSPDEREKINASLDAETARVVWELADGESILT